MICSSCSKAKYKCTKTLEGTFCDTCLFDKQTGDITLTKTGQSSMISPRLDSIVSQEDWKDIVKACKPK